MKRYYITDRKLAGGLQPLLEIIRGQMKAGVNYIQIREKDLAARELCEFARAVAASRSGATKILINGRADVARASGCDGVHLPASAPRAVLNGLLVGRSCHTLDEVRMANDADLTTFGPVFASPGKGAPVGLEALAAACRLHRAVFALGGIDWENAKDCVAAGAIGIAGIRLFQT